MLIQVLTILRLKYVLSVGFFIAFEKIKRKKIVQTLYGNKNYPNCIFMPTPANIPHRYMRSNVLRECKIPSKNQQKEF